MDETCFDEQPESLRMALELRREGARISGLLRDERGTEHRFSGWLGLLTLLDAAHRSLPRGA
jgi:hypothetical protein